MTELQICLLGSFQVCWDYAPISHSRWRNPFAAKLLQLVLVKRPDPISVADAVRLIGGGMNPDDLTLALEQLQKILGAGAELSLDDHGQIRFHPGPRCWIDIDAFVSNYQSGIHSAARGEMLPAILSFQEADALYQGAVLEETQEPWVVGPRRYFERLYSDVLDRLAEGHAVLARYQDAVGFCHKALVHAPLREDTFQRMMVYYYYLGDLVGSQEAYRACCDALTDASRTVSAETVELMAQLTRSESPGVANQSGFPRPDITQN